MALITKTKRRRRKLIDWTRSVNYDKESLLQCKNLNFPNDAIRKALNSIYFLLITTEEKHRAYVAATSMQNFEKFICQALRKILKLKSLLRKTRTAATATIKNNCIIF